MRTKVAVAVSARLRNCAEVARVEALASAAPPPKADVVIVGTWMSGSAATLDAARAASAGAQRPDRRLGMIPKQFHQVGDDFTLMFFARPRVSIPLLG